jgi:hypothetical protein
MPHVDGMRILKHCQRFHPDMPVVMVTAYGTVESAVSSLKEGAFDFITKPFEQSELLLVAIFVCDFEWAGNPTCFESLVARSEALNEALVASPMLDGICNHRKIRVHCCVEKGDIVAVSHRLWERKCLDLKTAGLLVGSLAWKIDCETYLVFLVFCDSHRTIHTHPSGAYKPTPARSRETLHGRVCPQRPVTWQMCLHVHIS